MSTVRCNYHMHSAHSFDSSAPMERMCRAALAAGLTDIAFTDHVEMPAYLADGFDRSIAASFREADVLRETYAGRLRIARGVELGEPTQDPEAAQSLLAAYPFDFVLGSLHNLRGEQDFYYFDYASLSDGELARWLDRYFDELLELASRARFHSLAHMDYPLRYFPAERRPGYGPWMDRIDAVLDALVTRGLALELNTSGLDKPEGRAMPEEALLRRFRERGGELVTLGSDAHRPDAVTRGLDKGAAMLRRAGFRYAAVYAGGRPEPLPLP